MKSNFVSIIISMRLVVLFLPILLTGMLVAFSFDEAITGLEALYRLIVWEAYYFFWYSFITAYLYLLYREISSSPITSPRTA